MTDLADPRKIGQNRNHARVRAGVGMGGPPVQEVLGHAQGYPQFDFGGAGTGWWGAVGRESGVVGRWGRFGRKIGVAENRSKIDKTAQKGVGRSESVPLEVFLDTIGPGLSFDVYYSPRDPLVAALEFLENRKIWRKSVENRVVGGG